MREALYSTPVVSLSNQELTDTQDEVFFLFFSLNYLTLKQPFIQHVIELTYKITLTSFFFEENLIINSVS